MSRRPTAAEEKRLAGNPGHRPVADPVVPGGRRRPTTPGFLRPAMRRVYIDVRRDLEQAGILAHIDGHAIKRFAMAEGLADEIVASFEGMTLQQILIARSGRGRNQAVTTLFAALTEARLLGNLIGDSPSARSSLGLKGVEGGDELEELLGPTPRQLFEQGPDAPPRRRAVGGGDD